MNFILNPPIMGIQRIEGYDRVSFQWWWIAVAIAVLMISLAVWRCVVMLIRWFCKPTSNPRRLYRTLMRVHRLNGQERTLLNSLAKKLPKQTPESILFVDPSSWEMSRSTETTQIAQIQKLFTKIFGMPFPSA